MSRDDFDLSDFGEMDEPSFSEDDAEFLPPDTAPGGGRPPRNTTFMIVAVVLVIVFILGIVLLAAVVLRPGDPGREQTAAAIQATNNAIFTAVAQTATAKSWTFTPSPTLIPTDTPTFTPSPTPIPTNTPTPSLTPVIEGSQVATTEVAIQPTETLLVSESATPGPSATGGISMTDLANTQSALKTLMAQTSIAATCTAAPQQQPPVGCGGPIGAITATPVGATLSNAQLTGTARQLTASAKAVRITGTLPKGGIFEDIAGGKASSDSLAIVGLGALALVGVIVVSRRLRIK